MESSGMTGAVFTRKLVIGALWERTLSIAELLWNVVLELGLGIGR